MAKHPPFASRRTARASSLALAHKKGLNRHRINFGAHLFAERTGNAIDEFQRHRRAVYAPLNEFLLRAVKLVEHLPCALHLEETNGSRNKPLLCPYKAEQSGVEKQTTSFLFMLRK